MFILRIRRMCADGAGRWTVANPAAGLFLGTSSRMSGGIDSVVWGSKEFINAWDHGRELQLAVTSLYGECFNPTEVITPAHPVIQSMRNMHYICKGTLMTCSLT